MTLVDLTTAQALQELGYDGEYTKTHSDFDTCIIDVTGLKIPTEIPLPRLDDAAYWLRDKHGWNIRLNYCREAGWFADILNLITGEYIDCDFEPSYDDALEHAVLKAIEIIKNKKQ